MNIRIVSYHLFARHTELVSASHTYGNHHIIKETLKQVQGDVRFMMHNGYSITKFLLFIKKSILSN